MVNSDFIRMLSHSIFIITGSVLVSIAPVVAASNRCHLNCKGKHDCELLTGKGRSFRVFLIKVIYAEFGKESY